MADTFKVLAQGQLAASVATIYTAATAAVVKGVRVVNDSGTARTFQLFVNGTAAANAVTPTITLAAGSMWISDDVITLAATGTIAGVAAVATTLTFTILGMET